MLAIIVLQLQFGTYAESSTTNIVEVRKAWEAHIASLESVEFDYSWTPYKEQGYPSYPLIGKVARSGRMKYVRHKMNPDVQEDHIHYEAIYDGSIWRQFRIPFGANEPVKCVHYKSEPPLFPEFSPFQAMGYIGHSNDKTSSIAHYLNLAKELTPADKPGLVVATVSIEAKITLIITLENTSPYRLFSTDWKRAAIGNKGSLHERVEIIEYGSTMDSWFPKRAKMGFMSLSRVGSTKKP